MADDAQTTLITTWVFTWLAEILMAGRLILRKVRRQKLDFSDKLTMAAMGCLLIRLALCHVVITWGTSNISASLRASHVFTPTEIYQREIGSKLTLAVRCVYNT